MSYRSSHSDAGCAAVYAATYRHGYYRDHWGRVERPLLEDLLAEAAAAGARALLDFACGTGRITELAPRWFPTVVGVDVAGEMLDQARARGGPADYLERDITREPLPGRFDVVTAFRFFLNAEPTLRREALGAIRAHLRGPNAVLIANVHVRAGSPLAGAYRFRNVLRGRRRANVLSERAFLALLTEQGFEIDRVVRYGILPRLGWWYPAWWAALMDPFERAGRRMPLLRRAAQCFVVVARRGR